MNLTPRWRKSGEPIKPGMFALMMLLPVILTAGFMYWVFNATGGEVQKKNDDLSKGKSHAHQDR
jgi:hypothetical protein